MKITKTIFFLILSFIVSFFLIESFSGYLLNWIKNNDQVVSNPSNNNQKDLYEGYSWKDEYFKSITANKPPGNSYFPYVMWTTRNRSGLVSQDENGIRASYIPEKTGKEIYRIYTFGGSTMENIEVPNEYTIASNLVKLLSNSSLYNDYDFEIINFGSGAYTNTQEMIRLIYEYQRGFKDYGKPNLVVFFDGVNDIFSGVYLERPGIHDAYDRIRMRYDDINDFYLLKMKEWLRNNLKTIQLVDYLKGNKVEEDFRYFEKKDMNYSNYAKKSVEIYKKNMDIVKTLGSEWGFDSIFFLQPSIYTLNNGAKHDQNVFKLWKRKRGNMYTAFVQGYSQFILLSDSTEDLINLTGIFNNINKPIYKDYCHVGPFGDEKIAESIFPYVYKIIKRRAHD